MASDMQDAAMQMAETIQTAHINKNPSVEHDVNPSTAASGKEPVELDEHPSEEALSDVDDVAEDEIPVSILRPTPRRPQMPPLPDLRFEQSYLASIKDAQNWQTVTFITIRDQILMPLVQGMAWTLAVAGWKTFNSNTKLSGQSIGARVRRWWWETNNWKLPTEARHRVRR